MKRYNRYIGLWLSGMLMLLCGACSKGGSDEDGGGSGEVPVPKEPSNLEIHVYTPENPVVTRAEQVEPDADEKAIHTLDIWVFVSEDKGRFEAGTLIGHLSPQVSTSSSSDYVGTYQMSVSEEFAEDKPKVDVFVAANLASVGLESLRTTDVTPEQLKAQLIDTPYFGLSPLTTAPSSTAGLPMSGVLTSELSGNPPLLKVETPVKVVRAISKIRFVFGRTDTGETDRLKVNSITLDDNMIPVKEYLFLNDPYSEGASRIVNGSYQEGGSLTPLTGNDNIPVCPNPSKYAYIEDREGQAKGQAYENLINGGIEAGELAQVGRFYLRESDKKISGKINYSIGDGAPRDAAFTMSDADSFSRNHTWIVYGFFAGKEVLNVYSVDVTAWQTSSTDHQIHNW